MITLNMFIAKSGNSATWKDGKYQFVVDPLENGVNFMIRANIEVILLIEDDLNDHIKFKLAIGAQDNGVSWLSQITKGKKNLHFPPKKCQNSHFFQEVEKPDC